MPKFSFLLFVLPPTHDAFLLLNRADVPRRVTLYLDEHTAVRDLYAHQDLGVLRDGTYEVELPPHASAMIKVTGLQFGN
ncbi:MAG: hypothetical protein WBA12_05200 [Catalinimonas sp.]